MRHFHRAMDRSVRTAFAIWLLLAMAGGQLVAAGALADPLVSVAELPVPIRVQLQYGTVDGVGLDEQGKCCVWREFSPKPPREAEEVPEELGEKREFAVLPIADSKVIVSFEKLGKKVVGFPDDSILVRVDANGNRDLTDDVVKGCHPRASCGPFDLRVRHGRDTIPYSIRFKWFDFTGTRSVVWYTRSKALYGTVGGRRIAVLDENSNGRYNDPDDVVVLDVDGDGEMNGGLRGSERFLRNRVISWGEQKITIVEVDPVSATMTLDEAQWATFRAEVLDLQTGKPVSGARIEASPGPFVGTTDESGQVEMNLLAGQLDYVQVTADGYWGRVVGQGQEASIIRKRGRSPSYRVLLESGPCRHAEVAWCGKESLYPSSMTNSSLELESGVVGPRVGPYPGERDLGWYVPPSGLILAAAEGASFAVLEDRDFEDVTFDDLEALQFDLERIKASRACTGQGASKDEPELRTGSVLGVRTPEGRLGKMTVLACDRYLNLGWIVYERVVGAASDSLHP